VTVAAPQIELTPPKQPFGTVCKLRFRAAGWKVRSNELLSAERDER
jgi:hypothetical protein